MNQTILPLKFSNRGDFWILPNNIEAYNLVFAVKYWPEFGLILQGEKNSGKTSLLKIWAKKFKAFRFGSANANSSEFFFLDGWNSWHGSDAAFLSLFNSLKSQNCKLLIVDENLPQHWRFAAEDIKSRILNLPVISFRPLDNQSFFKLNAKLACKYGFSLKDRVLRFLWPRLRRESIFLERFWFQIHSEVKNKNINWALISQVIASLN